jgi:hypothetical protein
VSEQVIAKPWWSSAKVWWSKAEFDSVCKQRDAAEAKVAELEATIAKMTALHQLTDGGKALSGESKFEPGSLEDWRWQALFREEVIEELRKDGEVQAATIERLTDGLIDARDLLDPERDKQAISVITAALNHQNEATP